MIRSLLPRTFAGRLRLALVVCALTGVCLASAILVPLQYHGSREQALGSLVTQSRIIATHTAAALAFDDPEAGAETLAAFDAVPDVEAATLFRPTGEEFATYAESGDAPPLSAVDESGETADGRWLLRREPVVQDGVVVGVVVVAYDLAPLNRRLWMDIGVALASTALGGAVAIALSVLLQRSLYDPIARLGRAAQRIAVERDYATRADVLADDELGRLTRAFNGMLDQIEAQDAVIQRANAELRASNQEMEQFVYMVSHDLKAPVVTITGFVGLLRQDLEAGDTEGIAEALDHLQRAGTKMGRLIEDLLGLSRIGRVPLHRAWIDADETVENILFDLEPRIRAAGAEVRVERPLPRAYADPMRLGQLFENLLSNAIKYGGRDGACRITIGGVAEPAEARYFIRDEGPGIAPEFHQRIFGLFQRLDTAAEGTGVGLAIVARIVETHGGRAWVESAPGAGATFWFTISTQDGAAPGRPEGN